MDKITIIGLFSALVIGIVAGFGRKIAEFLIGFVKAKVDPEPYEVEKDFEPPPVEGRRYVWVGEVKVDRLRDEGAHFYLHPKTNGPCFRTIIQHGTLTGKEFLMFR